MSEMRSREVAYGMPNAHVVTTSLQFGDERLADVFIFQWHTALSGLSELDPPTVSRRTSFIAAFRDWWGPYFGENSDRPCVVLMPELSLPLSLIPEIDAFVTSASRPILVVAGLEFMNWPRYCELLSTLAMPAEHVWREGGANHLHVNAAMIWVGDGGGSCAKFVQPKRIPSKPEDPAVFRCDHILLLKSNDQTSGRRLNLCVQVCSDFANPDAVRELRRICEVQEPGTSLDFTFVLQWNEDQEAEQFTHAVQAYFAEPDGLASTDTGCLIFVNNANPTNGKSTTWGRSALHVEFNRGWRPDHPPFTCALHDRGSLDHQAAVLREPGPAVYWFHYKPRYLVPRKPGSGQATPFFNGFAQCCTIPAEDFDASRFAPILPIVHWLAGEWTEGASEFRLLLSKLGVDSSVSSELFGRYSDSLTDWAAELKDREDLATMSARTLFECHEQAGYPSLTPEPTFWCESASRGAKRFQFALALLRQAELRMPELAIRPAPGQVRHAGRSDELSTTLLWGAGERTSRELIQSYVNALTTRGHADSLADRLLLVLLDPVGPTDQAAVTALLREGYKQITEAETPPAPPPHLAEKGELVDPLAGQKLVALADQPLYSTIDGVASISALGEKLVELLGTVSE